MSHFQDSSQVIMEGKSKLTSMYEIMVKSVEIRANNNPLSQFSRFTEEQKIKE